MKTSQPKTSPNASEVDDDHAVPRSTENAGAKTADAKAAKFPPRKSVRASKKPARKVRGQRKVRPAKSAKAKSGTKVYRRGAVSKQDGVIALLRRPQGATIDALTKATGWQVHSVRGFLAGTVRKKLRLQLQSQKVDGRRTYRIKPGKSAAKLAKSRAI